MKDVLSAGKFHEHTAQFLYNLSGKPTKEQRYIGKKFNHASAYGIGPWKTAETINENSDEPPYLVISISEATKFHRLWHQLYDMKGWWQNIEDRLMSNDRLLRTVYGFERRFYGKLDKIKKETIAFEPQSTVADHAIGAIQEGVNEEGGLLGTYRQLVKPYPNDIVITNTSHDSGLYEVTESLYMEFAEKIRSLWLRPLMINGEVFTIPVDVEVGERWGELEAIKFN